MTANSSTAKKSTLVVPKSSLLRALSLAKEQAAPSRPKVTGGPRCYGRTPKGKRVVVRWYITNMVPGKLKWDKTRWWVVDFENGVQGEENGYRVKANAIEFARRHRDLSSAYTRCPF